MKTEREEEMDVAAIGTVWTDSTSSGGFIIKTSKNGYLWDFKHLRNLWRLDERGADQYEEYLGALALGPDIEAYFSPAVMELLQARFFIEGLVYNGSTTVGVSKRTLNMRVL